MGHTAQGPLTQTPQLSARLCTTPGAWGQSRSPQQPVHLSAVAQGLTMGRLSAVQTPPNACSAHAPDHPTCSSSFPAVILSCIARPCHHRSIGCRTLAACRAPPSWRAAVVLQRRSRSDQDRRCSNQARHRILSTLQGRRYPTWCAADTHPEAPSPSGGWSQAGSRHPYALVGAVVNKPINIRVRKLESDIEVRLVTINITIWTWK